VTPGLHHVELWVADPECIEGRWAWLLQELGFVCSSRWDGGASWSAGGTYLSLTTSPNLTAADHDRRRPGVNHLAFRAGGQAEVDALMTAAPNHGWRPLYADRYPFAGGPEHYAGWLEDADGFKVEVVATP